MINDQGIWDWVCRVGDCFNLQDLQARDPDQTDQIVISSLSPCVSITNIRVLQVLLMNEKGLWLKTLSFTDASDDIGTVYTRDEEDDTAEKLAGKMAIEMLKEYLSDSR